MNMEAFNNYRHLRHCVIGYGKQRDFLDFGVRHRFVTVRHVTQAMTDGDASGKEDSLSHSMGCTQMTEMTEIPAMVHARMRAMGPIRLALARVIGGAVSLQPKGARVMGGCTLPGPGSSRPAPVAGHRRRISRVLSGLRGY